MQHKDRVGAGNSSMASWTAEGEGKVGVVEKIALARGESRRTFRGLRSVPIV